MSPADADLALLETARRCDFYGIKLHAARDIEGTEISLSVAHMGIKVFHQLSCVSTFSWAKIRKLSFKRKRLMIKLHPENNETIEFMFDNRNDCKNFWKKCVEHHGFFRCFDLFEAKKDSKLLFSRGSSFRYHGRTQKQLVDYVREHRKRREPFQRPLRVSSRRAEAAVRRIQFAPHDGPPSINGYASNHEAPKYAAVLRPQHNVSQSQEYMPSASAQYPQVYYPSSINGPYNGSGANNQGMSSRGQPRQARPHSAYVESSAASEPISRSNCHPLVVHNYCASTSMQQQQYHPHTHDNVIREHVPNSRCHPRDTAGENGGTKSDYSQQQDPMSVSMPDVLRSEELKVVCREYHLRGAGDRHAHHPAKSTSGDNFLENHELCDNTSEGSYKLGADYSSQSDVGPSSSNNARVYATNFTTKRVGNVLVKRVVEQSENRQTAPNASISERQHARQRSDSNDAGDNADECSSTYSDYFRGSSVSAPVSTRAGYHHSYNRWSAAPARFCNAVPIPIDGPMAAAQVSRQEFAPSTSKEPENELQKAPFTARIIKPVLINTPETQTTSSSSNAQCQTEKITKPSSVGSTRKPIVYGVKSTFDPIIQTGNGEPPPVAPKPSQVNKENVAGSSAISVTPITSETVAPNKVSNPGLVIHRENIVITPEGIGVRQDPASGKPKPKVPPKPKNIGIAESEVKKSTSDQVSLLEPLDSVLSESMKLSEVLGSAKSDELPKTEVRPPQPAMISVESEDRPDVKKLHLFGSQIPYTLTMRNVDVIGTDAQSTSISCASVNHMRSASTRSAEFKKHRKSLDFVYRKRLPSQDSYSSQDHSISPTTPENVVNVAEYVIRKRSLSNDRQYKPYTETCLSLSPREMRNGRNSERRQTQTIPCPQDTISKESQKADEYTIKRYNKGTDENINNKPVDAEEPVRAEVANDISDDLPEPPPVLTTHREAVSNEEPSLQTENPGNDSPPNADTNKTPEAILAEKILSGVLETDF
ncbi:FERM adjacent (FA) domain-containing protein [Ditylenchus destructor]|nr:FERM adjacent (FA) domain-containing protein [Ditylenchus destructor]